MIQFLIGVAVGVTFHAEIKNAVNNVKPPSEAVE